MVQRKKEKTVALAIAVIMIVLSVITMCGMMDTRSFGVSTSSPLVNRFLYPFFHASIIHALVNVWVFISIVFIYNPSWVVLLIAYAIAVIVPTCFLSYLPTIGMSVVVYALFGYITPFVKRKLYFVTWMVIYIAIGFCFGSVNAWIHLYAYITGLLLGLLNAPIICVKK